MGTAGKRENSKWLKKKRGEMQWKQTKYAMNIGQACNGNRPSMQWKQAKHAMKIGQACNGNRPSMQWKQTKYERATGQACNGNRPSMNWQQVKHLGRWSSTLVCCLECREPMTIRHFYGKHVSEKHHLDCRKQCLFCFGRKQ
ncbi:hypothetical protein TNCV_1801911 [Trichonephila clavipes]|nr:hypothetical protein TNCV_1801911 [Trichonephila clavipes]